MKKIYLLLCITAIVFASCTTYESNNPSLNYLGVNHAETCTAQLNRAITVTQSIKALSLWDKAETDSARYEIEDYYFPNTKIRRTDGGIWVENYFVVNTNNQELYANTWTIIPLEYLEENNTYFEMTQPEDTLFNINMYSETDQNIMSLTFIGRDTSESIIIMGSGENLDYKGHYGSYNTNNKYWNNFCFQITQPIEATSVIIGYSNKIRRRNYASTGEVTIQIRKEDTPLPIENTILIFKPDSYTTIQYRGQEFRSYINL